MVEKADRQTTKLYSYAAYYIFITLIFIPIITKILLLLFWMLFSTCSLIREHESKQADGKWYFFQNYARASTNIQLLFPFIAYMYMCDDLGQKCITPCACMRVKWSVYPSVQMVKEQHTCIFASKCFIRVMNATNCVFWLVMPINHAYSS